MSYKPRHRQPSTLVKFAARGGVIAGAAAIAAASAGALAPGTAGAATTPSPLQVTFSADGNGTGAFTSSGDIALTLGTDGSTYSQASVNLRSAGTVEAPQTPPSFTTDSYAAGSARWVIELANGNYLFGFPSQAGGTATDDFTGAQWSPEGTNVSESHSVGGYETYQQALDDAGDPLGNVKVTSAYVLEDADQAAGTTDTISGLQYAGETLSSGGTVTENAIGNVTDTAGTAVDVTPSATTNVADQALAWSATGLDAAGLSIDSATGKITGTPETAGTYPVTVTATNAYGQTAQQSFTLTVKAAPPAVTYTAVPNGSEGTIRNAGSGKYLNVASNSYAKGNTLIQWDATGASHEKFEIFTIKDSTGKAAGGFLEAISPTGAKYYVVANGEAQLTLGGPVDTSQAGLAAVAGSSEDMLKSGSYYTFPTDKGYVMDDSGQSTANGAHVIAYPKNNGKNQQWSLP